MAAPQVTLQSITGVDVELTIAGVGSRSYAFVIDWHIRVIMAFAWFAVGSVLWSGSLDFLTGGDLPSPSYFAGVLLPTAAIYLLYHPILEVVMHGSTPGKRMAGVRIVTRTGDIPGVGALLIRNVFRLIDSLPFAYLVGLAVATFSSQQVRVGDMAAGTLLILDGKEHHKSFARLTPANSSLDPRVADLIHEVLERWDALDGNTRNDLARSLLRRADESLAPAELDRLTTLDLRDRLKALLDPAAAS